MPSMTRGQHVCDRHDCALIFLSYLRLVWMHNLHSKHFSVFFLSLSVKFCISPPIQVKKTP